jgi:hypothetical protein
LLVRNEDVAKMAVAEDKSPSNKCQRGHDRERMAGACCKKIAKTFQQSPKIMVESWCGTKAQRCCKRGEVHCMNAAGTMVTFSLARCNVNMA